MHSKATTIWAVTATAIALLLTGILIGQSLAPNPVTGQPPSSTEPGSELVADNYAVPAWLAGAPKEWRTPFTGSFDGYALLFDYERRELLVEQCNHPGFFDAKKNLPTATQSIQCTRVLTGTLVEFNQDGVMVMRQDGLALQVNTRPLSEDHTSGISMQFDGHSMQLIPGQPNDLNQAMVASDELKNQAQLLTEYNVQKMLQERARMATAGDDDVPGFSLPASADSTQ